MKNYLGQIKEKEDQKKKINEKEGECGICGTKETTTDDQLP